MSQLHDLSDLESLISLSIAIGLLFRELKYGKIHEKLVGQIHLLRKPINEIGYLDYDIYKELPLLESISRGEKKDGAWEGRFILRHFYRYFILQENARKFITLSVVFNATGLAFIALYGSSPVNFVWDPACCTYISVIWNIGFLIVALTLFIPAIFILLGAKSTRFLFGGYNNNHGRTDIELLSDIHFVTNYVMVDESQRMQVPAGYVPKIVYQFWVKHYKLTLQFTNNAENFDLDPEPPE